MLYMGTVAPGLEQIAESEIQVKLVGAWVQDTFRGRVLFGSMHPLRDVLSLRCIDNLYAYIARFRVGPHKVDLKQLEQTASTLKLASALTLLDDVTPRPKVFVSASRSGKHSYSRFDAADAVFSGLQKQYDFMKGTLESHDLAIRLDIMDDDALVSLKLTPPSFRFRGTERGFSAAALRPPVAHALIWASDPSKDQIFLDPFCGSGTIVAERAAYDAVRIIGSDISADALEMARMNVPAKVELHRWDACHIKMESQSVSCIVTNPPWGNQIAAGMDMVQLYRDFLAEIRRVVLPQGKVIVLTDQVEAMEKASQMVGIPCEVLYRVSLHGLVPCIFGLKIT